MDPSATLKKLKEQAELNSMKKLQSLFNTSDQLEQIQQHLNRIDKKKNIVEAQLKSAIQSHFISVNSCMEQLQNVNKNLDTVRDTIYSIEDEYKTISHLETTLHELRQEAYRHKQLKSAKENMKNILDVDELAKKAHQYLEQNQLLFAHKYLVELEKCRNDILMELGDPTETNLNDINLVDAFFKEVKEIQSSLQSQIFVTIDRMLAVVRKDPKQLVTALRIIEREEILDEDWRKKKAEIRFMPSDRPKKWKEKCLAEIKKYIENRVQGSRYKEREDDDSWFSKHLGNVCGLLVKDLEVVKKLCEPCFPPSYKIFEYFVDTVHNVLSAHLAELIETNQLQEQEFFILLSWQDTYKSKCFMGHPSLKIDTNKIKDLLDEKHYNELLEKHIAYTQKRMPVWFQNALDKCSREWIIILDHKPTQDLDGYYESSLPNDINSMLIQQLDLINYANDDRFSKATLFFLINLLNGFVKNLKDKVYEFRNNHFKNTDILKDTFVKRLVTTANDCLKMGEHVISIRTKFDKFIDKDEIGGPNDNYQTVCNYFSDLASFCIDYIIEDMAVVLSNYFKMLFTREWLTNDNFIQIIICTINDYLDDLLHLKRDLSSQALYKWHNRLKLEYIKGFLYNITTNRINQRTCADQKERIDFTNKIFKEVLQMEQFFKTLEPAGDKTPFDFSVLNLMNRVIKTDDVDFIGVEIGALIKKAPEMTSDMLYALLSMRGDISKSDFKDKYEGYVLDDKKLQANAAAKIKPDEAILMFKREYKV